jgi:hypothetical protein
MQLRYDEDFVEAAVFLCASGRRKGVPALQIGRFHRQREKLYSIADPDDRNAAFFRVHLDWFREWGLEEGLRAVLAEFPLMEKLAVLAMRKAQSKSDEGTELYVNEEGQRTGVLALRMERLAQDAGLTTYLRHEFTHLHDMLDPAFGYSPALDLPGLNQAQVRLARERYRLLWDITIDGRLARSGHAPFTSREDYAEAFARGYTFWTADQRAVVFESLWLGQHLNHAHFLSLIADPRGLRDAGRPAPGGSCPLCGFPTFHWADPSTTNPDLLSRVAAEFPHWSVDQGFCGRCLETYEAAASVRTVSRGVA